MSKNEPVSEPYKPTRLASFECFLPSMLSEHDRETEILRLKVENMKLQLEWKLRDLKEMEAMRLEILEGMRRLGFERPE